MDSIFLGQYLLANGLLNAQQLVKALTFQEDSNKKLGELALEKKMLTAEQVKKILDLQRKEDIFFGEGVQRLGYLTSEQVDTLLQIQKESHICIDEAIVRLGYLTKERMNTVLTDFIFEQNEISQDTTSFSCPETLSKKKPFIEILISHTIKLLQRMSGICVKFEQCEIKENEIPLEAFSTQLDYMGSDNKRAIRYILLLSEESAKIIHAKTCKHNDMNPEEITLQETLYGLISIICGVSCNSLRSLAPLEPTLPKILLGQSIYSLKENEKAILVQLITPYGRIRVLIVFS